MARSQRDHAKKDRREEAGHVRTVPVELARGRNRRGRGPREGYVNAVDCCSMQHASAVLRRPRGLVVRRVRAVQDCWAGEEEVIRQHLHLARQQLRLSGMQRRTPAEYE